MFKQRKFWIILAVLLVLPFCLRVQAEILQATPYGQACMKIPTSAVQEYTLRWARLGADFTVAEKMNGKIEIDFSAKTPILVQAFAQRKLGKSFVISYGKQLTPPTALYPGSRGRQLTQTPHMFDGTTCFAIGIAATYKFHGFTGRVMQFAENQWSGAITFNGLSGFWTENELSGALFESPWTLPMLHPSVGFGSKPNGRTMVTCLNFWQVAKSLRVYTQADLQDGKNSGLVGISFEQASLCFVRLFREFTENQRSTWAAELTFAF